MISEQAREDILQIIEQEGLEYALREYSDVFKEAEDKELNKLVNEYNRVVSKIEKYLKL
jgi:hypothetical protein